MPALEFELGSRATEFRHLTQKNFKPFRHRNTYASIYSVYKRIFLIYINITVGLKKLTVMRKNRQ